MINFKYLRLWVNFRHIIQVDDFVAFENNLVKLKCQQEEILEDDQERKKDRRAVAEQI